MSAEFPHLHVKTVYSPMRGLVKLETLAKREVACVTDTTLWAAARLAKMRKKAATIYGLEVVPEGAAGYVVLLAEDTEGWRTLCEVGRDGLKMGQQLRGVHLLTGGAEGVLMGGGKGSEESVLQRLRGMVPDGYLWVELAPTQGERWVELWNLANTHDLPVVATGDVVYAERGSRTAWHVMRAIGERRRLQRGGVWEVQEGPSEAGVVGELGGGDSRPCWGHLASAAEMASFFARCPAALRNAADLAARCKVRLDLGIVALPDFVANDGQKLDAAGQVAELRRQAEAGLRVRLDGREGADEYWSRLSYELDVIAGTGFAGYFLIYADFVRWGKANGVPFGTGRGSAAGSIAVWALGITECDPIVHNLLFERFLNPERVSSGGGLPDIDIDICKRRRGDVVEYLRSRYGRDAVGRIINFKVLVGKTALKDVGRAFGIGYHRLNGLTAGVPNTVNGKTPKLTWMVKEVAALREAMTDPEIARVVGVALELEGCIRESGVHASGVVVSRGPLTDWVPTFRAKNGELCSAWDMREAEDAGLVKLDLLGLSTVTMISLAERIAGVQVDQGLNDPATFKLMAEGDTHGVFQMGKGGFRRMLRELRPDRFGDVVAAGALYRPGPIQGGMVKAYCRRKHGHEEVTHFHPLLESVTGSTYGTLCFQEQVMSSARVLAGYSLGEADILRRAMGKKKPEEMRAQRAKFVGGCVRLGTCDERQASEIFDLIDHFSGYGFNVSHSTAYGMLSYYTGWLKQHHPLAFYAALLSILTEEADSYVKIAETVYDMHEHGVRVLPPDVNLSKADFAPEGGAVRYGLRGLRGLGKVAVVAIAAAQPFASLADLLTRVKLGKRDLTSLVGSGALDTLLAHESRTRAQALRCLPDLLVWCKAAHLKPKVNKVKMEGTMINIKSDEVLDILIYWMVERERVRMLKESGSRPPWTNDPIISTWRFCNVDRCDDRETRWIFKNIIQAHANSKSLWFNLAIARFVNWSPTISELGFFEEWDETCFIDCMKRIEESGQKVWTGAYMIPAGPPGVPKAVFLAKNVFTPLWGIRDQRPQDNATCSNWDEFLRRVPCMGDFLRNQIITDMKYTQDLATASDWDSFVLAGPGTQRGLSRLTGNPLSKKWKQYEALSALTSLRAIVLAKLVHVDIQHLAKAMRDLNNLSNCLCELDKYCRVKFGEGKPRSRYAPQSNSKQR